MQHRTYSYKIQYLGDAGERGREWCTVTVHGNGDRTIRARCEMDDSQILRDVTTTVEANWRPKDAFVRVSVMDTFLGSAWFRFDGRRVECEGFTANEGRISQTVEFDEPPHSFITHPVACDVWHFANIDRSMPGKIQPFTSASCSPLPNGASGPMIGISHHRFRYQGIETIECPAGTFECEHVTYVDKEGQDRMDAWCTLNDRLLVKMRFDVLSSTYLLQEYDGTAG
ncbi:MAG: hypothetical protein O3C65_07545 [Proteobacteria bacterium]|nr:hypothetical protein [Pseudomonadota bacterium]MDA1058528.1 hypothetical protein [Pseudomonadota bacterium]